MEKKNSYSPEMSWKDSQTKVIKFSLQTWSASFKFILWKPSKEQYWGTEKTNETTSQLLQGNKYCGMFKFWVEFSLNIGNHQSNHLKLGKKHKSELENENEIKQHIENSQMFPGSCFSFLL